MSRTFLVTGASKGIGWRWPTVSLATAITSSALRAEASTISPARSCRWTSLTVRRPTRFLQT